MDYLNAVQRRCSRRKYTGQALSPEIAEALEVSANRYNQMSGLSMQLIAQNGAAFEGRKSRGMLVGVQNYFAMVGAEDDEFRLEKEGYYGEKLVLEATLLGLGSCWVNTSFDRDSCACIVGDGQALDCVIAIGYVEDTLSMKEKMMVRIMGKGRKNVDQLCSVEGKPEPWFYDGMDAMQKAPSARNLQPVFVQYRNGMIRAGIKDIQGRQPLDLGIAKLHFEVGAGGGQWQWGNDAEYRR